MLLVEDSNRKNIPKNIASFLQPVIIMNQHIDKAIYFKQNNHRISLLKAQIFSLRFFLTIPPLALCAFLFSSCSNPYSSMGHTSEMKLQQDLQFLEIYKDAYCDIKESYEQGDISRGRCLTLFYDKKENDALEDAKDEVGKRVSYVLSNPDEFDKEIAQKLSKTTNQIMECIGYINANCM